MLVLGRADLLPAWSLIPVIPLSTQIRGLAWEVELTTDDGVRSACVLKPEWIKSVDRTKLGPLIGSIPEARWTEIRAAMLHVFGLDSGGPS